MSTDRKNEKDLWRGLGKTARAKLRTRDYASSDIASRLHQTGRVDARELAAGLPKEIDIPGVEVFHRKVFHQRYRGWFSEFAREGEGLAGKIGLWPKQWATARMFAGTSKGFHIHPPYIPEGTTPEAWFKRLFVDEPQNYALRPYPLEQWDMMFFVQGICEMFLIDERAGMPRNKMRFMIEGDDLRGENNVGVVIPSGVAHAIRCASSQDLLMVYGTSTVFVPENEGRIAHDVETPDTPGDWEAYWNVA
jgi:dTDP-4-dehydrorhamnose 3,5-epimerase-like enzyme